MSETLQMNDILIKNLTKRIVCFTLTKGNTAILLRFELKDGKARPHRASAPPRAMSDIYLNKRIHQLTQRIVKFVRRFMCRIGQGRPVIDFNCIQ